MPSAQLSNVTGWRLFLLFKLNGSELPRDGRDGLVVAIPSPSGLGMMETKRFRIPVWIGSPACLVDKQTAPGNGDYQPA